MKQPDDEAIYEVAREIVEHLRNGYDALASAAADDMRELFAKAAEGLGELWSDPEECTRDTQVARDIATYFRKGEL